MKEEPSEVQHQSIKSSEIASGQKFDRLTALRFSHKQGKFEMWFCECICGQQVEKRKHTLIAWITKPLYKTLSCGCARSESVRAGKEKAGYLTQHGLSHTKTYRSWIHMLDRCFNQKHPHYVDYAGRGISVCERWRKSFLAFYEDMGERPKGLSLERIDNTGNYEPKNCKWATQFEQTKNMRSNRFITAFGETHHQSEWARIIGMTAEGLWCRLNDLGWSIEKALSTKPRPHVNKI